MTLRRYTNFYFLCFVQIIQIYLFWKIFQQIFLRSIFCPKWKYYIYLGRYFIIWYDLLNIAKDAIPKYLCNKNKFRTIWMIIILYFLSTCFLQKNIPATIPTSASAPTKINTNSQISNICSQKKNYKQEFARLICTWYLLV